MSDNWFSVDRKGLASLMAGRGREFVVFELLQNALDENSKRVDIRLEPMPGRAHCEISVVDDNPEGFRDLTHAYTLFAPSTKKSDPTKRGRFNFGEKMVLALCSKARIVSTTGTVIFDESGRSTSRTRRTEGTEFSARVAMTRRQFEDVCAAVPGLILTHGVDTQEVYFNGERIEPRRPLASGVFTLPTMISDADGTLRPTARQTVVEVFETREGENAFLYEMGIPVVEAIGRWHVNIRQKVPLNMDRDNVTPAYLRKVDAAVLQLMVGKLDAAEAAEHWVNEALEEDSLPAEVVEATLTARFGARRAIFDSSDREATSRLSSEGYQIVHGPTFSGAAWANIKRAGAILPAGQISPTPKPFTPGGRPLKVVDPKDYNPGQRRMVMFAQEMARAAGIFDGELRVTVANDSGWGFRAAYGTGTGLTLNYAVLAREFEDPMGEAMMGLLIHEFGHHYGSDHLSADYHQGLCRVGARIALWMARNRVTLLADKALFAPR